VYVGLLFSIRGIRLCIQRLFDLRTCLIMLNEFTNISRRL